MHSSAEQLQQWVLVEPFSLEPNDNVFSSNLGSHPTKATSGNTPSNGTSASVGGEMGLNTDGSDATTTVVSIT